MLMISVHSLSTVVTSIQVPEECASTSPVRTDCGKFVMCCIQCCMSMSAILECVDVLSPGSIKMFTIMMCLMLLMCTLTISK